jgi:hypothetical protein
MMTMKVVRMKTTTLKKRFGGLSMTKSIYPRLKFRQVRRKKTHCPLSGLNSIAGR